MVPRAQSPETNKTQFVPERHDANQLCLLRLAMRYAGSEFAIQERFSQEIQCECADSRNDHNTFHEKQEQWSRWME